MLNVTPLNSSVQVDIDLCAKIKPLIGTNTSKGFYLWINEYTIHYTNRLTGVPPSNVKFVFLSALKYNRAKIKKTAVVADFFDGDLLKRILICVYYFIAKNNANQLRLSTTMLFNKTLS